MTSTLSQRLIPPALSETATDACVPPIQSPNGGPTAARRDLQQRFQYRLRINPALTRRLVSYQANRALPGFRWLKYKEGFSRELVELLINHINPQSLLDPFSGIGTAPITAAAFPPDVEADLAKAREYIAKVNDQSLSSLLNFACMSVLESVSYTRKDGQYLRWDYRSGRQLRARVHKGPILKFPDALSARFTEIIDDLEPLKSLYGKGTPQFIAGSSLEHLRRLPNNSFDLVITSPPYANRYDYTRTYALELAWLNYDRPAFTALRQNMLSATVENKSKRQWLPEIYGASPLLDAAVNMYDNQPAIHEIAAILKERHQELGNPQVIRLLEGYFLEMAVVIAELGRIIRPHGAVFMVNDNVQYHGEEVPVDLILSAFAEQSGFKCQRIWVLPRGKGNSSQQMGRFGRRELRKCVYQWVRNG